MLVLSRRVNERILVDDTIRITVVGIRGNQVRLGIEAPNWVSIYREELLQPRDGERNVTVDAENPANSET